MRVRRSPYIVSIFAVVALAITGCAAPNSGADQQPAAAPGSPIPAKPSAPVSLHLLDVGGASKLFRGAIEAFAAANPDVVSKVTIEAGGAPDLVGTIKPQVDSKNLSVDVVLTGNDGLSAGIGQNLWVPVVKDYGDRLPNMANYIDPAAKMEALANGYGVLLSFSPGGPLLQYDPAVVKNLPKTPEALLAWAKSNPGKLGYARPANSGPGRTWLQGLPYLLGDKDPKDPVNGWAKTWTYLKELGKYINNYPTGTGQVVTNMANGTWSLTPIQMGWDIYPRAKGQAPNTLQVGQFSNFTWVSDAHFAAIPRGLSADKMSAILLLLNNVLTPEQNAKAFDSGYFYPGPSIKGATLDKAPKASQDVIKEFGRTWYDEAIKSHDIQTQLDAASLVKAFDIWDREVGSGKYQAK